MKRKSLIISLMIFTLASLTACGHEHAFSDATCTVPMTCSECGITEGEALGHTWVEATCDTAMTCSMCGITEGEALGHTWVEATCETAKTCSVCGATEGNPLEHSWIEATTEVPKTCELCGLTDGEPLVVEEETETEEVDEETTEGCRNTVPEEEVQWYLDNLHLTRQEFDQKTDEELSALVMQWLEDMANQSNPGTGNTGGGTGGGNNSGGNEDDPNYDPWGGQSFEGIPDEEP